MSPTAPRQLTAIEASGIDPVGRAVLERQLAGPLEQDVDHHSLRGRQDDVLDEPLVLDMPAVAADQLHACARQSDLEDAGVGGIGQVEADDLVSSRSEGELGLAVDQQDIAEAAHRGIVRLGPAERCDLAFL